VSSDHITKIKEKVAPIGIIQYDNSLKSESVKVATDYYLQHNDNSSYTEIDYFTDIKNAVGEARALYQLKELNKKKPLKKNINEVIKHVSGLINALKEMENNHYTLSILRQEIERNSDVLGYQVYKKFLSPGDYADCELDIVLPVLKDAQVIISCAAELKTKDWQLLLSLKLVEIHVKMTDKVPKMMADSGENNMPPVYKLVDDLSLEEFKSGTSSQKVIEAINILLKY
jgi:hypothetical protein